MEGLRAKAKRRYKATTDSSHDLPVAENRVAQRFEAQQPTALWLSDITYLRTQEGWLYLCCVLDMFTREIVGWAMKPSMHAEIVTDALTMATKGYAEIASGLDWAPVYIRNSRYPCTFSRDFSIAFGAALSYDKWATWEEV